jgi:hypothetical protein
MGINTPDVARLRGMNVETAGIVSWPGKALWGVGIEVDTG